MTRRPVSSRSAWAASPACVVFFAKTSTFDSENCLQSAETYQSRSRYLGTTPSVYRRSYARRRIQDTPIIGMPVKIQVLRGHSWPDPHPPATRLEACVSLTQASQFETARGGGATARAVRLNQRSGESAAVDATCAANQRKVDRRQSTRIAAGRLSREVLVAGFDDRDSFAAGRSLYLVVLHCDDLFSIPLNLKSAWRSRSAFGSIVLGGRPCLMIEQVFSGRGQTQLWNLWFWRTSFSQKSATFE